MDDEIRKAAYKRWEDEGHPEGQHERHWREAEEEVRSKSTGVPQTWSSRSWRRCQSAFRGFGAFGTFLGERTR
ncbi:DUF2934 domain-containing protein [Rhizobium leguminosarum]|uniref:DUF2934 domain-containing protein n=1 Tax=Rhizobium leguminosarum TaxID=384 RepID=A0A7W9ZMB0_RHILE|nr:DUF2934 domain-containing protein [Rhizobium leguminosarum]MBB6219290.1 hypothetical protein [Rhizobium leguminosarum]